MTPPRRPSPEEHRSVSPIIHESEPIIGGTTESNQEPRRRSKELKFGVELRNPFKKKQVRIITKPAESSSRHEDSDMETIDLRPGRTRGNKSPPMMSGALSPRGSPVRPIKAPSPPEPERLRRPRAEYVQVRSDDSSESDHRPGLPRRQFSRDQGSSSPRVQVLDEPLLIDSDRDDTLDRLESEARRARRSASREKRLRREAQMRASRAEHEAAVEKERRREAERRSSRAEREMDLDIERRLLAQREARRERERSEERRRRLLELEQDLRLRTRSRELSLERRRQLLASERDLLSGDYRRSRNLSSALADLSLSRDRGRLEPVEDLRQERGDPGARLILQAQESLRREQERPRGYERRSRGHSRIIMDDDDFRSGPRWR
ncbi:MAG: hypothetical protein Q9227_006284 [Pyrenula ochraceoflavens]